MVPGMRASAFTKQGVANVEGQRADLSIQLSIT